jgi:hypothetical protein
MQRVIAVIGVVLVPAIVALGASVQQPAKPAVQAQPRPLQDEAPIRVRNGSVEIETLRGTKWVPASGGRWSQDTGSPGGSQVIAEVRFGGKAKCTVHGQTITVTYGSKKFLVTRASGKLRVAPQLDFDVIDSRNPVTLRSKAGDYVTEVRGNASGSASCTMDAKDDLRDICIASTQTAINNNCQ